MNLSAVIKEFGRPSDVISLERGQHLPLGDDDVRVKMSASVINPSDLITISGAYRSRTSLPFFPGFEGVGTIVERGRSVTDLKLGQRVIPTHSAGAWQEFRMAQSTKCLRVDDGLSDDLASMSYVNPMTAWVMVNTIAKLHAGSKVAITAAGSNIGQILIYLANAMGISPIAFVRSEAAVKNIAMLNANVVKYENQSELFQYAADHSSSHVDVIFDCVGGADASALFGMVKHTGQFIHYGLLSGQPISQSVLANRPDIDFTMFHLRAWVRDVEMKQVQKTYNSLSHKIMAGMPGFHIRRRYSLFNIKEAVNDAENFTSLGKITLRP